MSYYSYWILDLSEDLVMYLKHNLTREYRLTLKVPLASILTIGNLIFLWSWTPRTTPRSSATHAPGSGLISTDALKSKFYQICLAFKGSNRKKCKNFNFSKFLNFCFVFPLA